jgi:hypothetical protein
MLQSEAIDTHVINNIQYLYRRRQYNTTLLTVYLLLPTGVDNAKLYVIDWKLVIDYGKDSDTLSY